MANEKTATFGIRVPTETNADESANSVEELGAAIKKSQDAVKGFQASLRALRGSSDEVKDAKEKLKGAIDVERNAISKNALAVGKLGKNLGDITKGTKEATKAFDDVKKGFASAGGPIGSIAEKLGGFKEMLAGVGSPAGAAALAIGLVVAATVALGAAALYGIAQLSHFILESGNLLRTQGLLREAFSGSEANAKAWGQQIDDMASRLPMTKAALNELTNGLEMTFGDSRVSEKAVVNLANAMGQVSIRGPEAANALKGIFEASKNGRGIAMDVQALGKAFGNNGFIDVSKALAKNLKIGLNDAQNAMRMGLVPFEAGAQAFRDVAEKKFGKLNLRMMLDLDVMAKKLKDSFAKLTEGVNLEPILEGFSKLGKIFDTTTVTGSALKDIFTFIGNTIGKVFTASIPFIQTFFEEFELLTLQGILVGLKFANYIKKEFGIDLKTVFGDTDTAVTLAKIAFYGLAGAIGTVVLAAATLAAPFVLAYEALKKLWDLMKSVWPAMKAMGAGLVDGITGGITSRENDPAKALEGVSQNAQTAFRRENRMQSPSKVFAEYGKYTVEGYTEGIEENKGQATQAVANMAGGARPKAGGGSDSAGGGSKTLEAHFHFPNAKNGKDIEETVNSPSFKANLTRAIEELLQGAGVATSTPQAETT